MRVHAPLVAEHDIIRRMLQAGNKLAEQLRGAGRGFNEYADRAIDFWCMYVDRCHQAKEEDILFHHFEKKKVHESDRSVMKELIEDHVFIMRSVGELVGSRSRRGVSPWNEEVVGRKLKMLSEYYLGHIKKENEVFFPRASKYFSYYEQNSILREFWRFNDKNPLEEYNVLLHKTEALAGMASCPTIRLFLSM